MTDKTQAILDLAKGRLNNYRAYLSTSLALNDAVLDRLGEVEPLEGEVWNVIPTLIKCKNTVVSAIKCTSGWQLRPDDHALDDEGGLFSERYIYPVERIAEAPITKEGKE